MWITEHAHVIFSAYVYVDMMIFRNFNNSNLLQLITHFARQSNFFCHFFVSCKNILNESNFINIGEWAKENIYLKSLFLQNGIESVSILQFKVERL